MSEEPTREIWKPVTGYRGFYEVSRLGRVRSLYSGSPQIMKTELDRFGYERVSLSLGGKRKHHAVHRLVCEAFNGIGSEDGEVIHRDHDRRNNCAGNLRWATRSETALHAMERGTHYVPSTAGLRWGKTSD